MLEDYSPPLRVCLSFVSLSPSQRLALLPSIWPAPRLLDNGYAFVAEQPLQVMADFCAEWLRLQELWQELPDYTVLALADAGQQQHVQAQLDTHTYGTFSAQLWVLYKIKLIRITSVSCTNRNNTDLPTPRP